MPELRKDPILGRWVIVASERAKRPGDFKSPPVVAKGGNCPFCEGKEADTPPEIVAIRNPNSKPNSPGWQVRVVRNKFPALTPEGTMDKKGKGLYDQITGIGTHEVIIECPNHVVSMSSLSDEHITNILLVYRERLNELKNDHRFIYGLIFKNVGEIAGASLEHSHSQLIATPIVPIRINQEMAGSKTFFDYRGRCIFCDIINQELDYKERLIEDNDHFIALNPFASRFPFETWILPRQHMSHFEAVPQSLLPSLSHIMKSIFTKLEKSLNNPPYNMLIHSTPFNISESEHYHWHIEIIPRITRTAGFEWGTGFYINPVPPEDSTKYMRQIT
jgi:UDPglucose--hexose-1-phosphate uridylyltransferase